MTKRIGIIGTALLLAGFFASARTMRPAVDSAHEQHAAQAAPPGMVYVPAGDFWQGTDDADAEEDARPRRKTFLPGYYMDKTEVTNGAFRQFRKDWIFPKGEENLPATNVTYDEAAAFAAWAGKRLPTDAEWEKAARGTDGRRFPWGDTWDKAKVQPRYTGNGRVVWKPNGACAGEKVSRVQPVGGKPAGTSPYGCYDMAGNAWEWVQGHYNNNPDMRILRGGAVGYGETGCRTYARSIEGSGAT